MTDCILKHSRTALALVTVLAIALLLTGTSAAETVAADTSGQPQDTADIMQNGKITLTLRNTEISEIMEMLSRTARVNILLSEGISGKTSVNLYDVDLDDAIQSIAASTGHAVERRRGSYFIVNRNEAGKHAMGGPTKLRTFKVQYSRPDTVAGILENHLSSYGTINTLPERRLLIVQDQPAFLDQIALLLKELDREPKQILIEAQILEVGLKDTESFGLDWTKIINSGDRTIEFGIQGLSNPGSPGLFFDYVTPNVSVVLDALRTRERLQTLSTPKLLALEDQVAETIIGDRLGYHVTTTIDNVTTTSTEFLESGVILKVKPSVDEQNRVLLEIHPEVSTGSVSDDGIPNQTTTEVTTTMLVESGKTVFIGGLIKRSTQKTREGVPVLGDIPLIGNIFSNRAISSVNTELVVLITPYIIDHHRLAMDANRSGFVRGVEDELERHPDETERALGRMQHIEDSFEQQSERVQQPDSYTPVE